MEPFIGQICLFPYNFAPRGWAFCQGQQLPISQYSALFALLGTTYGGNGTTTFGLPDLRGRVAVSFGQGQGLSNYSLGEMAGQESVTLISSQMPAHTHLVSVSDQPGTLSNPSGNILAASNASLEDGTPLTANTYGTTADATLNPSAVSQAGGNQAHENRAPYLALNYCIALEGIFPSRN